MPKRKKPKCVYCYRRVSITYNYDDLLVCSDCLHILKTLTGFIEMVGNGTMYDMLRKAYDHLVQFRQCKDCIYFKPLPAYACEKEFFVYVDNDRTKTWASEGCEYYKSGR